MESEKRSLPLLSLLCFGLADVRDGLGPFLGVFLLSRGWTPENIGFAMTAGSLAGLLFTIPLGALTDATTRKRLLLGVAVCGITLAAFLSLNFPAGLIIGSAQVLQGVMAAAIAPALTGLTLGLVGPREFPRRLGRNEAWNHAGNCSTAILGGLVGYFYGFQGVFFVLCCMAALSLGCVLGINPKLIDHNAARGLDPEPGAPANGPTPHAIKALAGTRPLLVVAFSLLFFHMGNAALLPLLGQSAVATFNVNPAAYTAGTIVIAQLVMIPAALWSAGSARRRGYVFLFFIALAALIVRGVIAGMWQSPFNIVPVQILDGIGAGVMGVATPGIVAVILRGGGHMNMGLGFVMTAQGIGAACSTTYAGLFARHLGYRSAFLALSAAACAALFLLIASARIMPDTSDRSAE